MIVVPRNIGFLEWTYTLFTDLPMLNLPLATDETKWKEWAESLILTNQLSNIPLPENFDDWRNWAEFLVNNV